ncbi:non-specific lipid transfer protein GPI-anchored 14-like [Bidens hawaiensis]|uniref:non-specific lipid transfer protein GPI-anchored 14-like n=1 Tax=Bidens hawaiensis TaxID=980011 RepID=UPI00404A46C5
MGSQHVSNCFIPRLAIVVMLVCGVTKADIESDKKQCADKLVALATCLAYVGGQAPAPAVPPKDCCTGIKQVVRSSMVCLCMLVKDRNDPSLNLKINETLALGLPSACQTPVNMSACVGLLHLQPGSPDAKVFEEYEKRLTSDTNTTTITPPGTPMKGNSSSPISDGGRKNTHLGLQIVGLLFIMVLIHLSVSNVIVNYQ